MSRARANWGGLILGGLIILTGAMLMFAGDRLWAWAAGQATGNEALMIAVATGDTDAARRAIKRGASVDGRSMGGYTPLLSAAAVGDERFVTFLLAHGAAVDAPGPEGITALGLTACLSGDVGTMHVLLLAGASPNGGSDTTIIQSLPLVYALSTGHYAAAELLLKWGADPNLCASFENGATPLTAAAADGGPGNERIVRLLIAAGADVNRPDGQGLTPLRAATEAGDMGLAKILRQAGADARGG
jgi:ankyrin repeat protein